MYVQYCVCILVILFMMKIESADMGDKTGFLRPSHTAVCAVQAFSQGEVQGVQTNPVWIIISFKNILRQAMLYKGMEGR